MKIDVKHIAKLANLPIKDAEIATFEKQLSDIVTYIEKLNELDTTGVKETAQATDLQNITREDVAAPSLPADLAVSQAAKKYNDMFIVPAVLDKD